jgi:hypothetical protein
MLNNGVRGNVSTHQLNTTDIGAMIEGDLLPHRPALLAATIGITVVGPKNLPVKSLLSLLSVNRKSRVDNTRKSDKPSGEPFASEAFNRAQVATCYYRGCA